MRVKTGIVRKRRHNKIRKLAKGFRGRRSTCYAISKRAVEKSLTYSYRDRKVRKREFRKLWNIRINAAAKACGLSYSKFIHGLKRAKINLDRKSLANLATSQPNHFKQVVEQAKNALA